MKNNQSNYKTSGKQIARNSLYLYFQQLLGLVVSLVTVRYTMSTLGVVDYGVNSVVAGTVSMFQFLVGALSMGTQRFFSFYIGKEDKEMLAKTFKQTFTIYFLMAVFVVLLTEIVGVWFIENKLVIPVERLDAARIIFQVSVVSMFLSILQAPFMASVIAHENMKIFAQMSIYDVIMRLIVVFLLVASPFDKLISYSMLNFIVGLSTLIFYQWYTRTRYIECHSQFLWDRSLANEILGFNVWNLFGQFAWMMKNQGLGMLLNTFFGPVVNASQQVGTQIRGICVGFSQNINAAVNPQIIKSYAAEDYERMFSLVYRTSKINFFLMLTMTIPILFHLEFVLNLWLVEVPKYAVIICELLLIENLVETSSLPFATVNQATGKIALYQFLIGLSGLLNVPFAYIALILGYQPEVVFVIGILLQILIAVIRLVFVRRVKGVKLKTILTDVYLPCITTAIIVYSISYFTNIESGEFLPNALGIIWKVVITIIIALFVGFNQSDRVLFYSIIRNRIIRK